MNYSLFKVINQLAGHHPITDGLMVFMSRYAFMVYGVVLLLLWFVGNYRYKKTVMLTVTATFIGLVINVIIGHIYFEPRPFVMHHVHLLMKHAKDASFPSDHATVAFSVSLMILFRHRKLGVILMVYALLTAISRVYVGNHYPLDVAGSFVVSVIGSVTVYRMRAIFIKKEI